MTSNEILETVISYLNHGDHGEVWAILSALRGPDSGNDELKYLTTARIRAVLGLQVCGLMVNYHPLNDEQKVERDRLLSRASPHFTRHYQEAVVEIRKAKGYDLFEERAAPKVDFTKYASGPYISFNPGVPFPGDPDTGDKNAQ